MDKGLYKELAERLRDEYGVNTDKLRVCHSARSRSASWVTKYPTCALRAPGADVVPAAGRQLRHTWSSASLAGQRPAPSEAGYLRV